MKLNVCVLHILAHICTCTYIKNTPNTPERDSHNHHTRKTMAYRKCCMTAIFGLCFGFQGKANLILVLVNWDENIHLVDRSFK